MDPSAAVLTNAGMGYRPLATGIDNQRVFGTQGLPFTGGPYGGLVAMGVGGPLNRMMGQVGMVPMGVGHDQNVYDRLMRQRFTMMQMQAMSMAAQNDRDEYVKTFRGLAAVTGTPFGGEQRRAAMSLANSAVMMSPLFAEMMPDFLDQLGGTRGSAAVMTKRMIDAGRYRMDPVSGRMGMSAESVGAISNRLYGDLYSHDGLPQMKGVTAGQVGSLVRELQMRGMIGTAATEGRFMGVRGDDPRAATFRAIDELRQSDPGALAKAARATKVDITSPKGITAEDLDKLQLDPRVSDKLRSFDTQRIKKSVKSYVDVVAAMRDIFGDMGKPNAPMAELIAGVEALTMGGMSQIDPGRMSAMVRQTYNLAKQTGVTMGNVLMMQNHAANRAGQMGIEPGFAVQATQGGLAFGGAYRAQGHAAHTAWGAFTADQVQQLDTNLRVQAASSNTANRMAVAVRLAEGVGGFAPDSEAGRYVAAVRGGLSEYRTASGDLRSVMMSDREFTQLMTGARGRNGAANISEGDVQTLLGQRDTNREYVERYGMTNTVRRLQGTDELHPFVGHRMTETLTSRFRDQLVRGGMDAGRAMDRARTVAARISQSVTRRMFDMGTEEFADTASRNRAIGGFIQDELTANGMDDVLAGLDPARRAEFLNASADRFYGAANRAIRGSMYRSFGNLQNVHRLTNRGTLDESDRQQMYARFTAENQEALAPLGHGSMLSRAVDAVKGVRGDDPNAMMSVLAEALGGVRIEDINRSLMPRFQKINAQRKAVEDLQAAISKSTDPGQRADFMERLEKARQELTAQAGQLAKTGEQFGLFSADTLTHRDLMRAMGSTRGLMTAQNDIIGLRGNFGAEVTKESLDAFRAGLSKAADPKNPLVGGITDGDRMAVVVAGRNNDLEAIRAYLTTGAALTPQQKAALDQHVKMARQHPAAAGMNDYAVQRMAADIMQANITNVAPEELAKVTEGMLKTNDEAARAAIRGRRQALPFRASDEAVAELAKQYPQMTREEAYDIANTRMRAARLGLDEATVKAHIAARRKKDPNAYPGVYGEVEAIADLFGMRAEEMYTASTEEVNALTRAHGYKAPTADELKRFREDNPELTAGRKDFDPSRPGHDVNHLMHMRMVVDHKRKQAAERFDKFWSKNEGAAFREQTDLAFQDVENVAGKLIQSPQMVQRLGTRAVEISDSLRGDQQRLRELAMFHTGGDVSKLMARDFRGIGEKDPDKARDLVNKLNAEITQIQYRQRSLMAELAAQEGQPGRRFQLGDEDAARREILRQHVAAGNMDQARADRIMASGVSPAMARQIEQMRRQLGSEESARNLLRIDLTDRNLTDLQRAEIAGVRFGVGSEAEARILYGQEKWDALKPGERAAVLKQMQTGTKTDEAAMRLLGISAEQLKADGPAGDLAKKIRAVKGGLASEAHAVDLVGAYGGKDDKRFKDEADYKAVLKHLRSGLYSDTVAREKLGIGGDLMPKDLQAQVDQMREGQGNEMEARRLLGFRPGQKLTEAEQKKLSRLTYDVGVARRVRPEDESALVGYETRTDRMRTMAASRGINAEALEHFGETFLLTGDQRTRMAEARRQTRTIDSAVNALRRTAANLRSQIAAIGDNVTDPARMKQREALKAQLAGVEGQIATQLKSRGAVEAGVADDAKARGVSAADYIAGKGWIEEQGLTHFRGVAAERAMDKGKIEDIAKGLGVKPEDLAGATGVTRRLLAAQRAAAGRDNANPVELTRDILKEYGFEPGSQPDPFQQNFARLLEGTAGKGMGRRILDTQRELGGIVDRRAGRKPGEGSAHLRLSEVDALAKEYFAAVKSGKAADMEAFRSKYGMLAKDAHGQVTGEANASFEKFQQAIQFQQQTGFLTYGYGGTHRRGSQQDLARLYSMAMGGGEMRGGPGGQGGPQMPSRLEMSGTVTLKGDQLDFSGAWGGGRAYGVPGGN